MYIFKQNDIVPWGGCVATVGFFDGIHAGHRFLLQELKEIAQKNHLNAVVVTFDKHPRKVLHAAFQPQLLTTQEEKIALLSAIEIDACVVLNFTEQLSRFSAYEYMKNILQEQLKVKVLLVGHDHRFGYNRQQGFDDYVEIGNSLGISVLKVGQFVDKSYPRISSSQIRDFIQEGKIGQANEILTYPYSLSGKVVAGNRIGHEIGFPTANIVPEEKDKIIPATGVYAVNVLYADKTYRGMMNIGYRPTLKAGNDVKIEVNIFDFDENIYNKTITVQFLEYLRGEIKFRNLEELKKQLYKDKETAIGIE